MTRAPVESGRLSLSLPPGAKADIARRAARVGLPIGVYLVRLHYFLGDLLDGRPHRKLGDDFAGSGRAKKARKG